jgi:hypothetical protein
MRVPRMRFTVRHLMIAVAAVSVGLAVLVSGSETLAGTVLLLTLGMLAVTVLGIVYRRGEARAFWLGFALFGWGYTALALGHWWVRGTDRPELVTSTVLTHLYLSVPHGRLARPLPSTVASLLSAPDDRDERIWEKLATPASMKFGETTTLEEITRYVRKATQHPGTGSSIPIYIDPVGLDAAHLTMSTPVPVSVESGLPLRTTLALALRQFGLTFYVRDGLLTITKGSADPAGIGSFLRIGHCYLALLAGWVGGLIGRRFHATRHVPGATPGRPIGVEITDSAEV